MPTVTLKSFTVKTNGRIKETTTSAVVVHNNRRLYTHTDGLTYEFVGLDASGNRIYRDTRRMHG